MSIAPGFIAEAPAYAVRVYLGQQPQMAVERRLVRQLQAVYPWYASRKRVNDGPHHYIELDGASCDVEVMLRHSHVFFVRRHVYQEMLDKQLKVLQDGKPPKEPPQSIVQCLTDCNGVIGDRLAYEEKRMTAAKERCSMPFRRELDTKLPLERCDTLAMMRCVEEDETAVAAERRAKAFLPADAVQAAYAQLANVVLKGEEGFRTELDKKELKLLNKLIPADYDKPGAVAKWRPCDVTSYFRFAAERATKSSPFTAYLWGHAFRRYATHAAYLQSASTYWPIHAGLTNDAAHPRMPLEDAEHVCHQQRMFSATRFRAQYLYTSADHSKQAWRVDAFQPLARIMPLMGLPAAEDLLAGVLVDAFWEQHGPAADSEGFDDAFVRSLKHFVREASTMRDDSTDMLLQRAVDATKVAVPPLTELEQKWAPEPLVEAAAPAADDDAGVVIMAEDGAEHVRVPGEVLQ